MCTRCDEIYHILVLWTYFCINMYLIFLHCSSNFTILKRAYKCLTHYDTFEVSWCWYGTFDLWRMHKLYYDH
jgi:hypothetical protein